MSSALGTAALLTGESAAAAPLQIGPLQGPDDNGIRLPVGFRSRIIAISLLPVAGYTWHIFPDGAATFAQPDGGWIYSTAFDGGAGICNALFSSPPRATIACGRWTPARRSCA